jgi:hypothetical protein
MKTLADLKRRLSIGTRLQTVSAPAAARVAGNGGTVELASRLLPGQVRIVVAVQANGVSLQAADGHRSFLDFPRAAELRFDDEHTFTVLDEDERANRTYRVVEES